MTRSPCARRAASYPAKRHEEMQAVVDALSLLANVEMAWNTTKWSVRLRTFSSVMVAITCSGAILSFALCRWSPKRE